MPSAWATRSVATKNTPAGVRGENGLRKCSNAGVRKQPRAIDWLQTSRPEPAAKRCFVWNRQSNSQRAKRLSLSLPLSGRTLFQAQVRDEFNITVKGQLNQ